MNTIDLSNVKKVYITEKQTQLEALAKVLDCPIGKPWHPVQNIETGIVIAPLKGHLYELLPFPENYSEDFKPWNESTVLCFPDKFKKRPKRNAIDQVNRTLEIIKAADEIILATDLDNEGANLGMTVIEAAGCESKVSRMLEMGSTTEAALIRTLNNPTHIPFQQMADAGSARASADWSEGMTLSRALTVYLGKGKVGLTHGGVKSPVIQMVVDRDLSFESHAKIKFYTLSGKMSLHGKSFQVSIFRRIDDKVEKKFETKEHAEKVKATILDLASFKLSKISKRMSKESPKQLYDNIELAAELSRTRNASEDMIVQAAQKLYETYKILSYPRTMINFIKEDDYAICPDYLNNVKSVIHTNIIDDILKSGPLMKRKSVFNDAEVTSHGGLTPTEEETLKNVYPRLSPIEKAMFDAVTTRFISNFMPDYEFQGISGEFHLADDVYCSFKEEVPMVAGWKVIYDTNIQSTIDNYVPTIPDMEKGDEVNMDSVSLKEGETKPKPRFQMHSLKLAMGNVARLYPENEVLKEELGKNGIGTPATIPGILKELFSTIDSKGKVKEPWLKLVGKSVIASQSARDLVRVTPREIMSPVKRAMMFKNVKRVETGEWTLQHFLDDCKSNLEADIAMIKELAKDPKNIVKAVNKEESLGACPKCKEGVIVERPKAFICSEANWSQVDKKWSNSGCSYAIFKKGLEKFGKSAISPTNVKTLLKTGKLKVKLVNADTKEKYETDMEVSIQYGIGFAKKVQKSFDSVGECPYCGMDVLNKDKGYSCSGAKWKKDGGDYVNDGCSFSVRKNHTAKMGGKLISIGEIETLLADGEVSLALKGDKGSYKKDFVPDIKWGLAWK